MNRLTLALALLLPAGAFAQDTDPAPMPGMDHAAHMAVPEDRAALPTEPGQSAFAAIQEIVEILEADPSTDWTKVDIEALRQHLIDMNNVTLGAVVASEPVDGGMRYIVSGAGPVRDSIRRMAMAHAETMDGAGGWRFTAKETADGAALTVVVADPHDMAKVRALGFIGALTRGMHHQQHHLTIALGGPHR